MTLQYDLFTDKNPMCAEEAHILRQEIQNIVRISNNVRKGLFARLGEQGKVILKLMQDIEELKDKKKPVIFEFPSNEPNLFARKHGS